MDGGTRRLLRRGVDSDDFEDRRLYRLEDPGGGDLFAADCVKAYYQADQIEEVCVAPPSEYLALRVTLGLRTDVLWYLKKMLPGQRTGGAAWIATAKSRLETRGYERNQASPQFYFHREKRVLLELHMDDIHGVGPSKEAAKNCLRSGACLI